MKKEIKTWIDTIDELVVALCDGKVIFSEDGYCIRKAKGANWIIMEDNDGVEYLVPGVEFETEVFYYIDEEKE